MTSPAPGKRALVTGATGYLGSHLVAGLLGRGWQVHVVTRPQADMTLLRQLLGRVTVHEHDGTTGGMLELMSSARPEVVFHLASLFLARHQPDDVQALVSSNLLFGTQLAEAMARSGVRHLVNTGTSWQHYRNEQYNPVNLYAATKQAFEDILAYYCDAEALNVTTLALFDTYGPGDPRRKIIPMLWRAALTQEPLMMSPGEQFVDFVYVTDVVEAFVLAAEHLLRQPGGHRRYGISSGQPMRLLDLVQAFQRATGMSLPVTFGGLGYRPREVMLPWADYEKLPGWCARVAFDVGIRQARPSPDADA